MPLDSRCGLCHTENVDAKNEALKVLASERWGISDAVAISGATRHMVVGWLRRNLIRTENLPRLYRPFLTTADLVRIRATNALTQLGVQAESAARLANELCGGDLAGMLRLKSSFVVFWSKDGLLTFAPCYPQSERSGIPSCEACLIISPAAIAHEVITKALDYLAEQERRAQEDSE